MKKRTIITRKRAAVLAAVLGVTGTMVSGPVSVSVFASGQEQEMITGFDFDNGIDGWYYGSGWEYDYTAKDSSSVEADSGQLKFNVDYTNDKDKGWSQQPLCGSRRMERA